MTLREIPWTVMNRSIWSTRLWCSAHELTQNVKGDETKTYQRVDHEVRIYRGGREREVVTNQ